MNEFNEDAVVEEDIITEEVPEAKPEYQLDDGTPCSRSAYIRQEFQKDRARKDIAAELDVKYYIVYSATANMFNSHHPEGGSQGSSRGQMVAKIDNDLNYVDADGNVVDSEEEAAMVPRADVMRDLYGNGMSRADIKDYFDVPYATVYAATKEVTAPEGSARGGKKVLIHPETGEEVGRADYIRELYEQGLSRREIAEKITLMTGKLVDYAVVWAATKTNKEEEVEVPEDVDVAEDELVEEEIESIYED